MLSIECDLSIGCTSLKFLGSNTGIFGTDTGSQSTLLSARKWRATGSTSRSKWPIISFTPRGLTGSRPSQSFKVRPAAPKKRTFVQVGRYVCFRPLADLRRTDGCPLNGDGFAADSCTAKRLYAPAPTKPIDGSVSL